LDIGEALGPVAISQDFGRSEEMGKEQSVLPQSNVMTIAEKILHHLADLSENEQSAVLDFVEYLEARSRERRQRQDAKAWADFSLNAAKPSPR
jgi:hypothetical protein